MNSTPLDAGAPRLTPYIFDRGGRSLYAAYHPAQVVREEPSAVVFCNPFGQEAVRSHRMYRVLADRAARAGVAALRFDYSSTGDSEGECREARVADWIADLLAAEREVIARSRATTVTWVGVRLGATLAVLAAEAPSSVPRRLVLWDPVVAGTPYLEELAQAHIGFLAITFRWSRSRIARSRGIDDFRSMQELIGFDISPELRAEISAIDLSKDQNLTVSAAALLGEHGAGRYTGIISMLARQGVGCHWTALETDIPWDTEEALNASTIPAKTLDALLAAIEGRS